MQTMMGVIFASALSLVQFAQAGPGSGIVFDGDMEAVAESDLEASAASSSPAYLVIQARNLDRDALKDYNAALPAAYEQFGGVYLAVQGAPGVVVAEGAFGFETMALSRWPSLDAIKAYWASPEYAEIERLRAGHGEFLIYAFEGLPPEPPAPAE